jgi:hypothetical protein
MTIFLIPLALLMLASECSFHSVTKYFDFISQPCGRGIYFIFVALLLFDPRYRMDMIVSIIVTIIGFLNIFHAAATITCCNRAKKEEEVTLESKIKSDADSIDLGNQMSRKYLPNPCDEDDVKACLLKVDD